VATNLFWFWLLDLTASLIKVVAAPLLYKIQVGVSAQGTPTQSHISPGILVYEDHRGQRVVAAPLLYKIQVAVRVRGWGLGFNARVQALAFWVGVLSPLQNTGWG